MSCSRRCRGPASLGSRVSIEPPLSRAVFAVDGVERTWGDVVAAAVGWGEWDEPLRVAREGIAAASEAGDSAVTEFPSECSRRATEYRRARQLLSADETAAWFGEWGVDVEDWLAHVRRQVLRERLAIAAIPVPSVGEESVVWLEGVVSGTLERVAQRLACSLAVHRSLSGDGNEDAQPDATDAVSLDASMATFVAAAAPPERVALMVDEHQLEWTALELWEVELADQGAAREVLYGVRDDGTPIEQVAAMARLAVRQWRVTVAELPDELAGVAVGARTGDVLGPLPSAGGWRVISVVSRVEPSADDPASAGLARELLVGRAIRREEARWVRWLDPIAEPRR